MSAPQTPTKTQERARTGALRLPGRWLMLTRGIWLALVILTLGIFFASLPVYFDQLQRLCVGTACGYWQFSSEQGEALTGSGLSVGDYAAYTVVLTCASVLVCLVVSTLIVWRRPDDRMAYLVALMLVTLGPTTMASILAASPSSWQVLNECLSFLATALFLFVYSVFPTGQFVPRWTRWSAVVCLIGLVPSTFFPTSPFTLQSHSEPISYLVVIGELVILVIVQVYRYRWMSSPLQRQQIKWVVFGIAVPIILFICENLMLLIFPLFTNPGSPSGSLFYLAIQAGDKCLPLFIPLSFGFAMLRYRLFDIDILINRTLVYGALTAIVVGVYVLVVGILGTLLHTYGNLLISLLATGLIAVLFHPLRERLQRAINRLLYGERDEPYTVLSRLGQRLEATLAPEALLPTIVETVAQALKLPYAALAVKQGETFAITATFGLPQDTPFTLPLVYHSETLGQLLLAPRTPGDPFTPADRRLLADIARQAGVAVHAVRLTTDLRHSREQLVSTREEERRRLRRDLHDGLGATLAALHLQAGAIRTLMRRDLPAADTELLELQTELRAAIADIRRLVYALRPPTLDELGLLGAIQQYAAQYGSHSAAAGAAGPGEVCLQVKVEAAERLPALPAAVEVAAYRIVQEAVTNVVRHAQAHTCLIRLALHQGLQLEIRDDGVGVPVAPHAGVGLASMRERAAEVGGTCAVEPAPGQGTRVVVSLPLPQE